MRGIPIGSMNLIESFVFPNALPPPLQPPPPKILPIKSCHGLFYETEYDILASDPMAAAKLNHLGFYCIYSLF